MTSRRIRAGSAHAAKRKATTRNKTVSRVHYIQGSKRGRMKTYSVTTRQKQHHTSRGWSQDRRKHSQESWERAYRKRHHIRK